MRTISAILSAGILLISGPAIAGDRCQTAACYASRAQEYATVARAALKSVSSAGCDDRCLVVAGHASAAVRAATAAGRAKSTAQARKAYERAAVAALRAKLAAE